MSVTITRAEPVPVKTPIEKVTLELTAVEALAIHALLGHIGRPIPSVTTKLYCELQAAGIDAHKLSDGLFEDGCTFAVGALQRLQAAAAKL